MSKLRTQFIRFHLAMSDDEIRALIAPYEAVSIERGEYEGLVLFDGGSYDEEDEMRRHFNAWADNYERIKKNSEPPWTFDADAWLRSQGFDPDELREIERRHQPSRKAK